MAARIASLKKCPFCGGKACLMVYHNYGKRDTYGIICNKCGVSTIAGFSSRKEAVKAWNVRTKK